MSWATSLFLIALGFVIAVWLMAMIWLGYKNRKHWKKVADFTRRNMKPNAYVKLKELEEETLWKILWS